MEEADGHPADGRRINYPELAHPGPAFSLRSKASRLGLPLGEWITSNSHFGGKCIVGQAVSLFQARQANSLSYIFRYHGFKMRIAGG
jgi:hypothetical protein